MTIKITSNVWVSPLRDMKAVPIATLKDRQLFRASASAQGAIHARCYRAIRQHLSSELLKIKQLARRSVARGHKCVAKPVILLTEASNVIRLILA